MKTILILGATSAIAQETARCFARDGACLFLVGRDERKLKIVREDLLALGATAVVIEVMDLARPEEPEAFIPRVSALMKGIDAALIAYGLLGDQEQAEQDFAAAEEIFQLNLLSPAAFLEPLATDMANRGSGLIAVIGSVAGDRGRKSNYYYGAAKAGLDALLSGLRNRLSEHGVCVLTIKPGFVDTPMTAHLEKGPLFASARQVGRGIHRAMKKRKDVVYLPGFWRLILFTIRHIPETIFKRMSI